MTLRVRAVEGSLELDGLDGKDSLIFIYVSSDVGYVAPGGLCPLDRYWL